MLKALVITPTFHESDQKEAIRSSLLSIAETNIQVRVLTTYNEDYDHEPIHKNIEVLQPFKKWSVFELPNIMRAIYGFQADIVHFIYEPSANYKNTVALAIPGIIQNFQKPRFVLQIAGNIPNPTPLLVRYWIQVSEMVFVEDDFNKLKASSFSESHRSQSFHVLHGSWFQSMQDTTPHWVSDKFEQYVYCCGPVRSLTQLEDSLLSLQSFLNQNPKNGAVFVLHNDLNNYKGTGELQQILQSHHVASQVTLLKSVEADEHIQLLKHCQFASITHLPLGAAEIPTTLKMAFEAKKHVLVPEQVLSFEKSLTQYLKNAITPKTFVESKDFDFSAAEWPSDSASPGMDLHGNQLSRAYQQLLSC